MNYLDIDSIEEKMAPHAVALITAMSGSGEWAPIKIALEGLSDYEVLQELLVVAWWNRQLIEVLVSLFPDVSVEQFLNSLGSSIALESFFSPGGANDGRN